MTDTNALGFTISQAVDRSPCSRSALYEAMKRGDLPAKKLGRRTIILREDLEHFLADLPPYQAAA